MNELVISEAGEEQPAPREGLSAVSNPRSLPWGVQEVSEAPEGYWRQLPNGRQRYVIVTSTPNHIDRGRTSKLELQWRFIEALYLQGRKRRAQVMRERLQQSEASVEQYEANTQALENE